MSVLLGSGKIYVGTNNKIARVWTNSRIAHYGMQGTSWDWSNLEFHGANNSLVFVPDPDNGGLQGDLSIGTGSNTSKYPSKQATSDINNDLYEIDPAGGTGQFELFSRELSYTYKFGPIFLSYQFTTSTNSINALENRFVVTSVSDPGDIKKRSVIGAGTSYFTQIYKLDVKKPSNMQDTSYMPVPDTADITVNFSIGPNNTPDSSYTWIKLIGFFNESGQEEYFTNASSFAKTSYSHPRNVPWKNLDSQRNYLGTFPKELSLLKIWQRPNILYYVHMKFVRNDYNDFDSPPGQSDLIESSNDKWDITKNEVLLYIEFGVSPDGGNTVWWNGAESVSTIGGETGQKLVNQGITSIVPDDIHKYITCSFLNTSYVPNWDTMQDSDVPRYKFYGATTNGNNPFKYVRIIYITYEGNPNDESNNLPKNVKQKYMCMNFEDMPTSTTATHTDDPSIDITTQKYQNEYWAKYQSNSQSAVKFQVKRTHATNPWHADLHVELNYTKNSLKYIGSTDGK